MMLDVPEKSGSLTRAKIAAGRALPDYSWCSHFAVCWVNLERDILYFICHHCCTWMHNISVLLWKLEIYIYTYIYDQCRRPFIKEKDHLAGWLTTNTEPTITKPKHIFQWSVQNMSKYWEECMLILIPNGISNSWALFCDPWSWVCPWTSVHMSMSMSAMNV